MAPHCPTHPCPGPHPVGSLSRRRFLHLGGLAAAGALSDWPALRRAGAADAGPARSCIWEDLCTSQINLTTETLSCLPCLKTARTSVFATGCRAALFSRSAPWAAL